MSSRTRSRLQRRLDTFTQEGPERTSRLIDLILRDAVHCGASDVHFEPTHRAVELRYRLDGVLQTVSTLRRDLAPNLVARLKVLAELLTYRVDIPQEGSIRPAPDRYGLDMRVSTFPTVHGEKVVVRLFDVSGRSLDLDQLGLSAELLHALTEVLRERTGAFLLTGPSGSGKTTTIYACLRHLRQASRGGRHIVTIEDPVEQVIEGISQSQARPGTDFDFARGLRSLLRQDPEIIMIGEVRDPETAGIAVEAALTGHLVFSTLHAGSACGVIGRLLDMGIEPYLLTSGLRGVLNQRLVRRLCPKCSGSWDQEAEGGRQKSEGNTTGLADEEEPEAKAAEGCEECAGTGYRGRLLLAEMLTLDAPLRKAILAKSDTATLEVLARQSGRPNLWDSADEAVAVSSTTAEEIERVLGPRPALAD